MPPPSDKLGPTGGKDQKRRGNQLAHVGKLRVESRVTILEEIFHNLESFMRQSKWEKLTFLYKLKFHP
jgi:hypothetical protein